MTPIIFTAAQAQELHTTGRLTGYREKCEWQPPTLYESKAERVGTGWRFCWTDYDGYSRCCNYLTPPRDTDTTYAVKEPCWMDYGEREWVYGDSGDELSTYMAGDDEIVCGSAPPVRQHARITDIKLIIESGELWWDMDLEKVAV